MGGRRCRRRGRRCVDRGAVMQAMKRSRFWGRAAPIVLFCARICYIGLGAGARRTGADFDETVHGRYLDGAAVTHAMGNEADFGLCWVHCAVLCIDL
jgi:hypothetical protein